MPNNNLMVMYGLPAILVRDSSNGIETLDLTTFNDVRNLFDPHSGLGQFAAGGHRANLSDLGINAILLSPLGDMKSARRLGHASASYFAPAPNNGAASDLARLVAILNENRVRLFVDVDMAGNDGPDCYPNLRPWDPQEEHEGLPFMAQTTTYHPETGFIARLYPSWIFHRAHLARWMTDISASGICIDNIQKMGGLEFVHSYAERARELFDLRYHGHGDPAKFLVIGKNLKLPASIGG